MLNPTVRKILDWAVGLTLMALGIAGWLLPILPGWLFIIAGLAVLSSHSTWAKALHERIRHFGQSVRTRVGGGKGNGDGGASDG